MEAISPHQEPVQNDSVGTAITVGIFGTIAAFTVYMGVYFYEGGTMERRYTREQATEILSQTGFELAELEHQLGSERTPGAAALRLEQLREKRAEVEKWKTSFKKVLSPTEVERIVDENLRMERYRLEYGLDEEL